MSGLTGGAGAELSEINWWVGRFTEDSNQAATNSASAASRNQPDYKQLMDDYHAALTSFIARAGAIQQALVDANNSQP